VAEDLWRSDRIHAFLMRLVAVVTLAYWVEFFTKGRNRTSDDQAYVDFERAFPLADAYMSVAYLVSARQLSLGKEGAVPAGIAAGSAMVFLGCMDLLYDLQHQEFADRSPEMAAESVFVGFSLVFGPITMVRMWRARHRLRA
jgi:hypothetical protein